LNTAFGVLDMFRFRYSLVFAFLLLSALATIGYSAESEKKLFSVDVLEPVYRQSIYATQNTPEILFVIKLANGQIAASAVYALLGEDGKQIRGWKAVGKTLSSVQKIEINKLPVGKYTLHIQLLDKSGGSIDSLDTPINKLAKAPGTEVRVDEKHNILVNGKPKLFIGWYGETPTEDSRKDVVALQNINTPKVIENLNIAQCREVWEKYGIYTIISVECGNLVYTFSLWKTPGNKVPSENTRLTAPSEEAAGYLKQIVDKVGKEPWLLGYYLSDEPEINNVKPEYLEATHKLMQELDPYHPVIITNDTIDGISTHGYKACDILNPDPYDSKWDFVPSYIRKVLSVAPRGKGIMTTLWHSSGQTHFARDWGTEPPYSYRVMRSQYLSSAAMGSRGFTAYTSAFFLPEPVMRYGLPPIWRELRFIEPALANTQSTPTVKSDAPMVSWLGLANGKTCLIVANTKPGARTARVSHPLLKKLTRLDVLSEARSVTVSGSAFTDRFTEGDVHIYTTDPAGRKLVTTAQVEKDIASKQAACRKPGNVLYVGNGVRARSTAGFYAPWFEQYFYYAINGITDDMGWYLSHAGDKPSSLDLTLPQVKNIARVVMYSPNVADYDIQFFSPDGSLHIAEIRGNKSDVAETNFQPAIPTLKLKITVKGKRPGSDMQPMVRELEAYETPGNGPVTGVQTIESKSHPPAYLPPTSESGDPLSLWKEDAANFTTAEKFNWDGKDDKWIVAPGKMKVTPITGSGFELTCIDPSGVSNIAHIFPYDNQYRYLQVKIDKVEGDGYQWVNIQFSNSGGRPGFRTALHTKRPGIYTVDTWYVNDGYRLGTNKDAYMTIQAAGSSKQADGTVQHGPVFTYDYIQLMRRPINGLVVTRPDGSPLPDTLKEGDQIMYRVLLEKPALDVTVEALSNYTYTLLPIGTEPDVQLYKTGAKDGCEWAAVATLGPGTGKYDGRKGYPICFRALIVGGAIKETASTMDLAFE